MQSTTGQMQFASFGARAGAYVVDSIIVYVLTFVLVTVRTLGFVFGGEAAQMLSIVMTVVIFQAVVGIYWWFYTTGWSPGRALVGIRIVDAVGQRPGARRGIGRLLMAQVSGLAIGIGYLAMLWSPQRQTWHDAAAGTYVIRVR